MTMVERLNKLTYGPLLGLKPGTVIGIFRDKQESVRFAGREPWNHPVKNRNVFWDLTRHKKIKYLGNYRSTLVPAIFFDANALYDEAFKRKVRVELLALQFDPDELQIFTYQIK